MPPLRSKALILTRLQTERRRLEKNLAQVSRAEMVQPNAVGAWTLKDVLAHLADWEARMPRWVAAARRGDPVETPEPGLTWKQLDILNERIYAAHRRQSLAKVLDDFQSAHQALMALAAAMPEDEMLAHGRYAFTGPGTVYDWLIAYAEHDRWGKTEIRHWLKVHHAAERELQPA